LKKLRGLYYGWVILLTVAFTEMVSWGVLYYAFTVFLKPMQISLGWSTGEITGAFSLALLCGGVAALIIGRWLDRYGARLLMTIGSCAASLLVLAWANVQNLVLFYLVWVGLGIAMAATLYDPAFALVATWFRLRRARALTLLTFIAGFASVIFVPLAQRLIEVQGWRSALMTLALLLASCTVPLHALVLRRRPADSGLLPDGAADATSATQSDASLTASIPVKEALRERAFWWITAAFALNALAAGAIVVHLVTALLFSLQAGALLTLLVVPGTVGIGCFVVLFGAVFGAITPARAALIADRYGSAHYAQISSILGLFLAGARAIAPVGAGSMYDLLRAYTPIFWVLLGLSLLATGAVLMVKQ
jgi:MFS family permease